MIFDGITSKVFNAVVKKLQGNIDSIQTTSRATLPTAGWYRVAEYDGGGSLSASLGANANFCNLTIKRGYGNTPAEFHSIQFRPMYKGDTNYSIELVPLGSKSATQTITKIRHVVDTSDNNKSYLEIYYSISKSNGITVSISQGADRTRLWQAITPTLTSETVDGVTVTTTYDIPANAKPVMDLDIADAMEEWVATGYEGNSEAKIDELYNSLHANAKDKSHYTARIRNTFAHSALGGGEFYVEGYRYGSSYGWQRATSYGTSGTKTFVYERSIYDGIWTSWERTSYKSDLANYLSKTGGTLKKNAVIDFEKTDDSTLSANIAIGAGGNSFGVWERGDTNRGVKLDLTECQAWNGSKFLHTGNSAKVVVSSTPLTAEGSVRVW